MIDLPAQKRAGKPSTNSMHMIQVGVLAWIMPGLGHWFIGQRAFAVVLCAAISLPYFTGLAFGGIKNSINPRANQWLFLAEMGVGGYTSVGYMISSAITVPPDQVTRYVAFFPESDIAMIYLSTAGLLNLLAILDALTRAQTGGLPVFYPEVMNRERAARERAAHERISGVVSAARASAAAFENGARPIGALLAWIPFLEPLKLPPGGRLWMFFPLALCVAIVYRITRERDLAGMPRRTLRTFINIVAGMILIAGVAYGLHEAVIRFS